MKSKLSVAVECIRVFAPTACGHIRLAAVTIVLFFFSFLNSHAQPVNDNVCGAITVPVDGSINMYSNVDATSQPDEVAPPGGLCASQSSWCGSNAAVENSVWFKFLAPASGNVSVLTCNDGTTADTQIAIYLAEGCGNFTSFILIGANDDLDGCTQTYASSLDACVIPNRQYYLQVDGYNGSSGDIALSLTSGDESLCIDCPDLGEDVGAPCDDGDSNTVNDVVTSNCECQGTQPCQNDVLFATYSFNGSDLMVSGTCVYESEYNTYANVISGETYEFTSSQDLEPGFITITSGAADGPVLGFGYSPVTVVSDINGTLYVHYTVDGACNTESGNCTANSGQCITCPEYCEDLDLAVGSPCDDGDSNTINDAVTSECECLGEQACSTGSDYAIRTLLETTELVTGSGCNYESEYNEWTNAISGNQYTFTSEDTEGTPGFITVRASTPDGAVLGFGFSPLTVTSNINGSLFAHYTVNGVCETAAGSCVSTAAYCSSCPVYCEILDLVEGTPCDDGDPNTNFDRITEDCECAGALPCMGDYFWTSIVSQGNDLVQEFTSCNLFDDYNELENAISGQQYTFTADDSDSEAVAFITVRSGSFDGTVIGQGYSPLTVTSDIDGSLFSSYTADEYCDDFPDLGCLVSTVQCISCPEFCEDLGLTVGDPCDDGDDETINDTVTSDCGCEGVYPVPANDLCENAESISVLAPGECTISSATTGTTHGATDNQGAFSCDLTGGDWPDVFYTFNSGPYSSVVITNGNLSQVDMVMSVSESCGGSNILCEIGTNNYELAVAPNTDYIIRIAPNSSFGLTGTFLLCVEGVYDCPDLNANIGDACDDGNPGTINDVVNSDCECEGEPSIASLSGSISWNESCGGDDIAVRLFEPGTTNLLFDIDATFNENGEFQIVNLPPGTYDIFLKPNGYLIKGFWGVELVDGINDQAFGSFIAGDVSNDNVVSIVDVSFVNASFGSIEGDPSFNTLCDFNCDASVNIIDVSILNGTFGLVGDTP